MMRGPKKEAKPGTPDTARSSGYSSSSSLDSRVTSPDRPRTRESGVSSPERPRTRDSARSRPSSSRLNSPRKGRVKKAWGPELLTVDSSPLAYTCYRGARHLHPERLPSTQPNKQDLNTLRIWERTPTSIVCIKELSPGLIRLDLRKMKLGSIKADLVRTMPGLETLNLSNNNLLDNSFDQECGRLLKLMELRLDDNKLTSFPRVFPVKTLRRLSISRNLLQSLQGLESLKRLQILTLEDNKIMKFERDFFSSLRKLEVLYMSLNSVKEIPKNIRLSKHLRILDLSKNQLFAVPIEVFELPNLVELNLSANEINRLPNWPLGAVPEREIQSIDLSNNQLTRFPDYLLLLAENLDLSYNTIKYIYKEAFLSVERKSRRLDLTGNPTMMPPLSVCQSGFNSLVRYFQEQKVNGKTYHGMKVYMLGSYMSGKTSLIQSMLDQHSRLEEDSERTDFIETVNMTMNFAEETEDDNDDDDDFQTIKSVNLSFWEFSGNTFYQLPQLYFLQLPGLIILTVNMATYDKASFYNNVGIWIEWIFCKARQIDMIIVGTKADRIPVKKLQKQKNEIWKDVNDYINAKFCEIEREIEYIESKSHITAALSEQLKNHRNLMKIKSCVNIHQCVIATSAKTMTGVEELTKLMESIIEEKERFPKVMSEVPPLWVDVETYITELGHEMAFPVLPWTKFVELVVDKYGMKKAIDNIAKYLHDTSKILYCSSDSTFSDFVVIRPAFVIELMKAMFKDNVQEGIDLQYDGLKKLGLSQSKIEKLKNDFLKDGILDRRILKTMWVFVPESDLDNVANYVMDKFQIGYALPPKPKKTSKVKVSDDVENVSECSSKLNVVNLSDRPSSSSCMSSTTSVAPNDTVVSDSVAQIVVPWMLQAAEPAEFCREYQRTESAFSVAAVFRFPRYAPIGLFERYTVRVRASNKWKYLEHWKHGVMATHLSQNLVLFLLRECGEDKECVVKLEIRCSGTDKNVDSFTDLAQPTWQAFIPVIQEMEKFLETYPGAFFERFVSCPVCKKLGFVGEWLAPKELQCIPGKSCSHCGENVPSLLLAQPKEKRGLDLEQIRRERRLRRAQYEQQAAENTDTDKKTSDAPPILLHDL